jgi:membrane associated rhomboid family serine protease
VFIPIGDSPNPRGTPWVTYTLIALNIGVFLVLLPLHYQPADPSSEAARSYAYVIQQEKGVDGRAILQRLSAYDALVFRLGFKPAAPAPLDLLTSMFLHGGFLHLLGNMLFLWIYGDNVEDRLGRVGYIVAYLGTGGAAALGDALIRAGSAIPSVGASGAISGVLGFYFIWFPRNRVRVLLLFPLATVFELPARLVLGFYLVVDNLLPLLIGGGGGGVAYGAHIGGFIAAVGAAAALNRLQLGRPEPEFRRRRPAPAAGAAGERPAGAGGKVSPGERFATAITQGDLRAALDQLLTTPRQRSRRELSIADKTRLAQALERQNHPRAALTAYQRVLSDHPGTGEGIAAHLGAARVLMNDLRMPTASYQHLYSVLEEADDEQQRKEARELLEKLRGLSGSVPRVRRP